MIKDKYESYEKALELLNMKTLYDRRQALSFNFAKRCLKTDKVKHFFPNNQNDLKGTRNNEMLRVNFATTKKYLNSSIPTLQRVLNHHELKKKRFLRRIGV